MNFRSIAQMNNLIRDNLDKIPDDVDLIVGIPRSGMLPATVIALLLNKPLYTLDSLLHSMGRGDKPSLGLTTRLDLCVDVPDDATRKVLVIDDSCNTGNSIKKVKDILKDLRGLEYIFACVYVTSEAVKWVDLYFEIVEQPRLFEWNIMNHAFLSYASLDLDGVLCFDPTDEQNDDGEKYLEFIRNARPLFKPQFKLGNIVTSRLEKYRYETEKWLERQGICYGALIMMDLPDMETRRRLMNHGRFKGEIYKNNEDILFIESSSSQAQEIFEISGKPVYCTGNNCFYTMSEEQKILERVRIIGSKVESRIEQSILLLEEAKQYIMNLNILDQECEEIIKSFPGLLKNIYDDLIAFCGENLYTKELLHCYNDNRLALQCGFSQAIEWISEFDISVLVEIVQAAIQQRINDFKVS